MEYEPLIYTEQGVVYLFSRYWSEIRVLKNEIKEITDTHTHFPDFYYINKNGSECGLEFEYLLSSINNGLVLPVRFMIMIAKFMATKSCKLSDL